MKEHQTNHEFENREQQTAKRSRKSQDSKEFNGRSAWEIKRRVKAKGRIDKKTRKLHKQIRKSASKRQFQQRSDPYKPEIRG